LAAAASRHIEVSTIKSWLSDNQAIAIFLLTQTVVGLIYFVNLESRVNTLEDRGSPHLAEINTRLNVLEGTTKDNKDRLDKVTDIMTKNLSINPSK
jgi:hypothetical protein